MPVLGLLQPLTGSRNGNEIDRSLDQGMVPECTRSCGQGLAPEFQSSKLVGCRKLRQTLVPE